MTLAALEAAIALALKYGKPAAEAFVKMWYSIKEGAQPSKNEVLGVLEKATTGDYNSDVEAELRKLEGAAAATKTIPARVH